MIVLLEVCFDGVPFFPDTNAMIYFQLDRENKVSVLISRSNDVKRASYM